MKALEGRERRAWYPLALIFTLVILGIFAGGAFSYRHYEQRLRAGIEQQLSAVAELKVAEIVRWRRERLSDANYLRATPYVARRALNVLAQPTVPSTRQNFMASLDSLFAGGSYEKALLLDERLNVGMVYPARASGVLGEVARHAAQEALDSRQVVVADLHRETEDGPVYLSLMVPLVVRRESTRDEVPAADRGSSTTDRSTGVLVLQVKARKELYPMIRLWPTPSRTAETLLVRRDGNEALFLNELRFRTNTALRFRIPLARTNTPAVKAALGQEGIVEGSDYRGVPVVAALRAIPDSPWAMVARIDTAEVYAPLRERLWMTVLLMGALLLGAGASVGFVWRQQRVRFYRERHQAAEALRASQQLIEGILNAMPARVFWKDKNLVYLGCNAAFARDAGFAHPKDIIGKDDYQMGWREQAELYRGDDRQVIESGCPKLLSEEPQTTREGNTLTLLTSKIPLRGSNGEISGVIGMYMDITERKQAEEALQQRVKLQDQLVHTAASVPGMIYSLLMRPDGSTRMPYASGALSDIFDLRPKDVIEDAAPVFSLIHPDDIGHVLATTAESARTLNPWRDDFRVCHTRLGEIWVEGHSVPQREPDGSTLWHGFVQDITERRQAEAALRRSEAKFRTLYDSTSDAVMLLDVNGFFDCNQATLAMFGCGTREEFCSKHPADVSPPLQPDGTDSLTLAKQHMATAMEKGSYQFEWIHKRVDTGETFSAEVLLCALELDGKPVLQGSVRDITERKRSEETLRLQSAALEAAANAIVITDHNGTIQLVNSAFTALTGYTAQEAVGQNPRILKGGKQDEAFYRTLWQTISSGQVWSGELTNRRKDGSLYAEEMTITPLRNADGVITRYIAIKQDISGRLRAAEVLRQSEEQFRAMFELASVGIAQAEPQTGQWLRVNKKMCEITGYSAGELLQLRVPDITHPEDRQLDREAFERVVRGEAPDYRMEKRYIRKDGALAWVNVNMTIIRDAVGQPTRTMAAIEDITERKRAETSLIRLAAIIESSDDAIIGKDLNSIITSWNRGAEKLFGYTAREMVGTSIMRLLPADRKDEENQILRKITQGESAEHFETLRQDKNGRLIEVSVTASPIKDDAGKVIGVSKVARDITERKRAQAELEKVHKQLLEASRRGGMAEIATNVLHNVGNVLNSVNISAGLIVESVRKSRASSLARVVILLREHAHDLGEFISQDSRGKHLPAHLAQLSDHLLAEQETNVRELDSLRRNVEHIKEIVAMQQNYASFGGVKEMINVAELVEDSLRLNEGALSRHEVEVIREFAPVPPMNVEKHKVLQILVNLLRNAKHACQDSERADRRLTVRVANGAGRIKISVIDNGVGIPPENLTRIFNHGFTTRKNGHGFGLHSGALAAREMGGSLTAHSDGPGQGAAFTLELPCPAREKAHE